VKSHDWEIGINDGPSHKVPANGTFKYCASKTVGAISPKIDLSAAPAGEAYAFGLAGPAAAGASLPTEGESFTSAQGGLIAPAFIPLTFPKLKAKDATSFPPGTYRFTLTVAGAPALTGPYPQTARWVKLPETILRSLVCPGGSVSMMVRRAAMSSSVGSSNDTPRADENTAASRLAATMSA